MNVAIVRTRLQSIIVERLLEENIIPKPFHLITLSKTNEPPLNNYTNRLSLLAAKTTTLTRPKLCFTSLFLYFSYQILKCKLRKEQIFIASITWYPFALALKLIPNFKINTFDDGSANITLKSMYFSESPSSIPGTRGSIARLIFPMGPCYFVRSRISEHFTIYPGFRNIVEPHKTKTIEVKWRSILDSNDAKFFPKWINKILLGTVYDEAASAFGAPITSSNLKQAIAWSDLYIPHPRQCHDLQLPNVLEKYAAEVIISYYCENHNISVAHFHSSACIPFQNDPRVRLIDLTCDDLSGIYD